LLTRRKDVPVWVLPGGGIEPNETVEQACLREVKEETGLQVSIQRLVGIYTPINRLAKVTYLYECIFQGGHLCLSSETSGIEYFPLNNLPLMPPPYPEWIEEGKTISPLIERSLTSVNYKQLVHYLFTHPRLVLLFLLFKLIKK
jgi:ADP-ribose pyrophosphatase YjhB (NUDIX family)